MPSKPTRGPVPPQLMTPSGFGANATRDIAAALNPEIIFEGKKVDRRTKNAADQRRPIIARVTFTEEHQSKGQKEEEEDQREMSVRDDNGMFHEAGIQNDEQRHEEYEAGFFRPSQMKRPP